LFASAAAAVTVTLSEPALAGVPLALGGVGFWAVGP